MGRIVHEKRLRGVHPQLVLVPKAWGVQLPFDVLITEGVRMDVRQRALYAQGRSTPGQIVTMAETAALTAHGRRLFPGGDIFGCAFDAVPCTGPVGQPNYNDAPAFEEDPADADIIEQIRDLIDTRVRPAVPQDGGDIVYRGYKDGTLYLAMQGACSGCPSSAITLKRGIEGLIKHYVPEVETIEAI